MKKTIVAVALAVVFVMALAVPAFAQMTHGVTYEMEGVIDFRKQAGHACNTGAVHKQTIVGSGEMSKQQSIVMIPGRLTMEDNNDYVAGETALTVTSVIELCAPPKYTYDDADGNTAIVHPAAMYRNLNQPYLFTPLDAGGVVGFNPTTENYDMTPTYGDWDAVSDQIWAVQVQADPGFSGNLHQDFEAAYGPYDGGNWLVDDEDWTPADIRWGWEDTGNVDIIRGDDYVGNYFNIDQHARTSMGEVKRYISISSPFSHAYLMEDMSVVGKSDIQEAFSMRNIAAGADVPGLWWDLF